MLRWRFLWLIAVTPMVVIIIAVVMLTMVVTVLLKMLVVAVSMGTGMRRWIRRGCG